MLTFEQLKSELLQLPEARKQELHRMLGSLLTLSTTHRARVLRGSQAGMEELVWNALRGIAFPSAAPLSSLHRTNRYLHARIVNTARELERGIQNLFPQLTQLQRNGVRTFFCHLAVSRLRDTGELVSPGRVLEALVPVEELCDDRFPGYRASNILPHVILQHIVSGQVKELSHVRHQSSSQTRSDSLRKTSRPKLLLYGEP